MIACTFICIKERGVQVYYLHILLNCRSDFLFCKTERCWGWERANDEAKTKWKLELYGKEQYTLNWLSIIKQGQKRYTNQKQETKISSIPWKKIASVFLGLTVEACRSVWHWEMGMKTSSFWSWDGEVLSPKSSKVPLISEIVSFDVV